jgi:hypothetical protein
MSAAPLGFTENSSEKAFNLYQAGIPLDLRVVAIKALADLDGVDGAQRYSPLDGECGCVTDGMSIGGLWSAGQSLRPLISPLESCVSRRLPRTRISNA